MRARIAAAFAHACLIRLTLVALLVAAAVPAGWMPNPDGAQSGAPIVICTGHGPITAFVGKSDKPAKPSGSHSDVCVFAAAATHATPVAAPALALPPAEEFVAVSWPGPAPVVLSTQRSAHSPRGPPLA